MFEQKTEIIFNKRITPDSFLMGLRSPDIAAEARPGQFVMIRVGSGMDPLLRRPFSICGIQEEDLISILYSVVGRGTTIMSRIRAGDQLSVLGPLGRGFELPKAGDVPLLVAGGIGVAPLIFLTQSIFPDDVIFMAGYGSAGDVIPAEEVGLTCGSMIISTNDGSTGHRGTVTELLESRLNMPDENKISVFTCGPISMLERMAVITLGRNIPCQISLEAHMACGLGACQGCAVKSAPGRDRSYYHVCRDGPVFNVRDLDWRSL